MTDDDVKLAPLLESPVLQHLGDLKRFNSVDVPTMELWRRGRTAAYGQSDLKPTGDGVEEELINGVVVKHYNWLFQWITLTSSPSWFYYIRDNILVSTVLIMAKVKAVVKHASTDTSCYYETWHQMARSLRKYRYLNRLLTNSMPCQRTKNTGKFQRGTQEYNGTTGWAFLSFSVRSIEKKNISSIGRRLGVWFLKRLSALALPLPLEQVGITR